MEFQKLNRDAHTLVMEAVIKDRDLAKLPVSALSLSLDIPAPPDFPALRVADEAGNEVLYVPLEAPCDFEDITAVLERPENKLKVTLHMASSPGMQLTTPVAEAAASPSWPTRPDSDSDSMHSALSDPEVTSQSGEQLEGAEAGDAVEAVAPVAAPLAEAAPSEEAPAQPPTPSRPGRADAVVVPEESAANVAEGGQESEAATKKKKKKKKKKAAGAAAASEHVDEADTSEVAPTETGVDNGAGTRAEGEAAAEEPAAADVPPPAPEQGEQVANADAQASLLAAEPAAEAPPAAPAAPGVTVMSKELPRRALSGPFVKDVLSNKKNRLKQLEDQWLVRPHNTWAVADRPGEASFGAWAIFDGHAGRQVATYASNSLLKSVMAAVDQPDGQLPGEEVSTECLPAVAGAAPGDLEEWAAQAEFMRRLPAATTAAFVRCNAEALQRFKEGGTTATLAVACGWELLVANVGDSCAYLDTGVEVLAVSGNHRLDDSAAERERVEAAGGEVATSMVDGKPAGPRRVWPGGLAMGRTIGDACAGDLVTADPEICQVTIPYEGARLIMASDGLWDAVVPKTAAHHTREMCAAEAAHKLLALAIKADNLKDDVTVIVVDFMPRVEDRLPPALSMHRVMGRKAAAKGAAPKLAHVWHPLKEGGDVVTAGAERRRRTLAAAEEEEVERVALEQRLAEIQAEKEAAAKAAADAAAPSALYSELASLRLRPEDLEQLEQSEEEAPAEGNLQAAPEAGDWETVGAAVEVPAGRSNANRRGGNGGRGRERRPGSAGKAGTETQGRPDAAPTAVTEGEVPTPTQRGGEVAAGNSRGEPYPGAHRHQTRGGQKQREKRERRQRMAASAPPPVPAGEPSAVRSVTVTRVHSPPLPPVPPAPVSAPAPMAAPGAAGPGAASAPGGFVAGTGGAGNSRPRRPAGRGRQGRRGRAPEDRSGGSCPEAAPSAPHPATPLY